jgi:glucokinase
VILAGDIGGTNTRLSFFEVKAKRLKGVGEETFPSRQYPSLNEIVRTFVSARRLPVDQACFGVAGPVINGRSKTTNLAWVVESRSLAKELKIKTAGLINDLEANAYGIAELGADDFVILNEGRKDATGNAAIIAAGTGLGEAGLYWDGTRHRPFACEGGHADFGPNNELQLDLLRHMFKHLGHVSWESVLSGPGLHTIYKFLRDTGRGEEQAPLAEAIQQQDPAAVISRAALNGACPLSVQALDLFVSLYGAEAGNLALKVMATGGVYVGGGIAPKIIKKLTDGTFKKAFTAKGRMQPLLEAMPVRVILNDKTALLGAARYAMLQTQPTGPPRPAQRPKRRKR